jgi:hypothetical protein
VSEREKQQQLRESERGPIGEERDRNPAPDDRDRAGMTDDVQRAEPLLRGETAGFRQEWESVQAGFVDEPRQSVERADALVARAAQRIAEQFAHERQRLEEQWGKSGDISTEDLRVALRLYRAFFERLLSS